MANNKIITLNNEEEEQQEVSEEEIKSGRAEPMEIDFPEV